MLFTYGTRITLSSFSNHCYNKLVYGMVVIVISHSKGADKCQIYARGTLLTFQWLYYEDYCWNATYCESEL